MDEKLGYVLLLALLEFYEYSWQRASTVKELLGRIYARYRAGIFYFFFSHPSFIFLLYVGIKYNLTNFWYLSLIGLKFFDIAYKLVIVKKIEQRAIEEAMPIPLEAPITPWMLRLNILFYPLMLYLALGA